MNWDHTKNLQQSRNIHGVLFLTYMLVTITLLPHSVPKRHLKASFLVSVRNSNTNFAKYKESMQSLKN